MLHSGGFIRSMVRAPMLRLAVPFVCGLVVGLYVAPGLVAGWAGLLAWFTLWWWLSFRRQDYGMRWVPGLASWVFFLWLGVCWQALHRQADRPDHVSHLAEEAQGWEVEVTEVTSAKPRTVRAWGEVRAARVDGVWQAAQGGLLLTLLLDSTSLVPHNGDRLVITNKATRIRRIPDPGGFDVRQWAHSRGVEHEVFAPIEQWRTMDRSTGRKDLFAHMRERINTWLERSGLPDRERALTKALLLGQRDDMEPDQNQAFIRSGTIHVLAVSGTHVGIIYVAVLWALRFLGKERRGRVLRGLVALLALWAYAGLTGFTPSVLRATVMFSLFTVAEMSKWRTDSLNSLAFAAVVLLLWDPGMLGQLGFQLSFLAVLGIVVLYNPVRRLWAPPNAVAEFFWSLIAVSLAAQVFTAPLCLYTFHAFPVWFLPANLAIVGLVGIGVYGGVLLLAVHALPVLGPMMAALMKWLLLLLGFLAGWFAGLPAAYPALRVGFWGMVGLYLLLALLSVRLLHGRRWAGLAAMATLAALFFGWGWTAHRRNGQLQFVVYQDRNAVTCAVVQGRTLHAFSSGPSEWTERNLTQHARVAGVHQVLLMDSMPAAMELGGGRIRLVDVASVQQLPFLEEPGQLVVLHGKGWPDLDRLSLLHAERWVLNGDMDGGARARMRRWAQEHGSPVHDMRAQGAYVRP